ncbi:MAG TPA: hypothetical protein VG890_08210 [Puia sp.]|nr:hypothetical protein [Puia sp.]
MRRNFFRQEGGGHSLHNSQKLDRFVAVGSPWVGFSAGSADIPEGRAALALTTRHRLWGIDRRLTGGLKPFFPPDVKGKMQQLSRYCFPLY